ncbi:hypothetical protein PNOK_0415600 [Pyrrhoderma noxium]|uniref:Uncharacterized protein n=1 Tax=Pyrrhoderma noxium TaxID=2282107 RepID=A0A286UHY1_9AGAM|nr:hypothetical protein PNOK_0415600 [Pyrrhoderma noxium]
MGSIDKSICNLGAKNKVQLYCTKRCKFRLTSITRITETSISVPTSQARGHSHCPFLYGPPASDRIWKLYIWHL